ncbi:MAG: cyclic nucleotide-binding domain-containing protein [Spirochaetota bacterium]
MPGVLRNYKAGSIIYFLGDVGDNIYVLKSGAVSLIYHSIETREEVRETIKNGEFFGVKSALAKRPREETALVIQPSQVLVLTTSEFEQILTKNVKIITNFLRVFSNQLRKVGKLVHNFLNHSEVGDNQAELFKIGEYYLKNHKYKQARYVYETYLKYYGNGAYARQARERITAVKNAMEGKGPVTYTAISQELSEEKEVSTPKGKGVEEGITKGEKGEKKETIDIATRYYDAVSLFSQEKYEEAYNLFKRLQASGSLDSSASEYIPKIEFEMGRCLLAMKRYNEAIAVFTNMIKQYPKDENLKDALFNIGIAYKQQGDNARAASFFEKVLKMLPESPVDRKAKKELASLK